MLVPASPAASTAAILHNLSIHKERHIFDFAYNPGLGMCRTLRHAQECGAISNMQRIAVGKELTGFLSAMSQKWFGHTEDEISNGAGYGYLDSLVQAITHSGDIVHAGKHPPYLGVTWCRAIYINWDRREFLVDMIYERKNLPKTDEQFLRAITGSRII